jgi:uncharacterized damage-inducible protein DinB
VTDAGRLFLDASARYLAADYLPRVRACVERLGEGDVWWRPNEASNSVGNLLLHLSGNVRQWIVSGVGGEPDVRVRHEEFDRREPMPKREALERLARAVDHAVRVLRDTDPARLPERVTIQGREGTVLQAVYHAVEHFSMHTGQVIYVAKLRTGEDAAFYEVDDGVARPRWDGWGRGGG